MPWVISPPDCTLCVLLDQVLQPVNEGEDRLLGRGPRAMI